MALAWKIELSDHQIAELTDCRDHHPKPYMRERAAAILKVAQAQPARLVATQGLLKTRQAHTVDRWLNSY
ncbi:MAG TPA: IS630 family transposase, partial [Chloroflexia bacterium]|nr:IS630 family transposase [Chloroflexia bacterium]